MTTKSFMEMDVDEFEDKSGKVVNKPNLDFDFDDEEETTPAEDKSSSTEINDLCISYAMGVDDSIHELDNDGFQIENDGEDYFVKFDYSKHERWEQFIEKHIKNTYWNEYIRVSTIDIVFLIKENGKITRIENKNYEENPELLETCNRLCDQNFATIKDLIMSNSHYKQELGGEDTQMENEGEPITDEKTQLSDSSEIDSTDATETTQEGYVQEGMFDAGFGNLRLKIAKALGDKFKVTNVAKGMGGKDKFDITETDADYDGTKTTVESTGTGCKVVSRGDGKFKCHFTNIPLSQALNKILELFEKPELLLEGAFYNISRSGGKLYMEDGEENTDNDDTSDELPKPPEDDSENEDADDSSSNEEATVEEDDIDISSFGSDTSDVQNEYDPGDIEILNKLIASENEAINDYFDGTKDTKDENLRTLYGDIGHEERFHLEQLLYAKSTLTGEKYEPRDPEVKKEYEELIAGGMDEDTAASTAIDKTSMFGSDNGDDSDIEELEQEAALIETMLVHNEILTTFCESQLDLIRGHHIIDKSVNVIMESFIQEEVDNVTTAPKQITKIQNPIALLTKGLKASINGLLRLSSVIKDSVAKSKVKNHRKYEWIKKHGIGELFKSGISLYFYSDKNSKMDFDTPAQYVDMMYRLTKMIGESCGIKLTAAAKHRTISNPIKFGNIEEGLKKLNGAILTPTKVVITDNNKDALAREFFGYSNEKIPVNVSHGENGPVIKDSNNIYNKMEILSLTTKQYCDVSAAVLDQLKKFEGDVNSIYYKNRKVYNYAVEGMKVIVNRYNQFIKAMAHDLKVMLTLDNGILKMTRERDAIEQTGGKWEGDDVRVSQKPDQGVQYTRRKRG